tara:strand:+ start:7330 stop:7710 length:381 start_codon:yes stop_codon:yes gene_type:complete
MADQVYDDTNRGAAFTPFPTQTLILQGKMNIEGQDKKICLIKDETKDGKSIIEIYEKIAVLFENDKDGNEKRPDFSGPMQNNDRLKVSGWRREKDDKPYISLSVGDKQQGAAPQAASALPDDTIPF